MRGMDRVLDVDPASRTARVQPGAVVILRAGKCVESVPLTAEEAAFLSTALGEDPGLQPIAFFIVALHQAYWPAKAQG